MAESVVQNHLLDPDTWVSMKQIQLVRPWLKENWFKDRRDQRLLPYTKIGGKTATCLYRLRDVDALIESTITPAEHGPLAQKAEAQS